MKEQSRDCAVESSQVCFETLEGFARMKVQEFLQQVLEEEVSALLGREKPLKARTQTDIRYHIEGATAQSRNGKKPPKEGSFDPWTEAPIAKITSEAVSKRFAYLVGERGEAQAAQAGRILGGLLNYAVAKDILETNPVRVLTRTRVWPEHKARDRRIPLEEIGKWWSTLQALRAEPKQTTHGRTALDVVSILALTGMRWGEASTLKWDQVDVKAGSVHLPDPKNRKPVTLPLSDAALEVLTSRPKTSGFIFPGRRKDNDQSVENARAVLKMMVDLTGVQVSAHDLRRTFESVAEAAGVAFEHRALLLNHTIPGSTTFAHYTDKDRLRLRPQVNAVAAWLEEQRRIHEAGAVSLDARRAGA